MKEKLNIVEEFSSILNEIAVEGSTLSKALNKRKIHPQAFYDYIEKDKTNERAEKYTRAMHQRADTLFDRLQELRSEDFGIVIDEQGNKRVDNGYVQRKRLEIDTIKWELSKLMPRKYGDKLDIDAKIDANHSGGVTIAFTAQEASDTDSLQDKLNKE